MPTTESHTAQLAALEQQRDEAKLRVQAARESVKSARSDLAREVTADLSAFHNAIDFQKPDATVPEERAEREAELSAATLDAIRDSGLTVRPIPTNGRVALLILDPHVDEELNAALAVVNDFNREIAHFVSIHAADLEAERGKAEMEKIREVIQGDDPEAARDLLLGRSRTGVFTTDDLDRPAVHKRSPVVGR
jgi:hypothetical protein